MSKKLIKTLVRTELRINNVKDLIKCQVKNCLFNAYLKISFSNIEFYYLCYKHQKYLNKIKANDKIKLEQTKLIKCMR